MTARELIERLSQMPPNTNVRAFDADSEEYEPVTGLLWDLEGSFLYIQTDDNQ